MMTLCRRWQTITYESYVKPWVKGKPTFTIIVVISKFDFKAGIKTDVRIKYIIRIYKS